MPKKDYPEQIQINEVVFYKSRRASIDSESDGFFRAMKTSIDFYDHDGVFFSTLVQTDQISPFFVSASRISDGRKRYNFGLSDRAQKKLGMNDSSFMQQRDIAHRIAADFRKVYEGGK